MAAETKPLLRLAKIPTIAMTLTNSMSVRPR
jgi:hypothetical protein